MAIDGANASHGDSSKGNLEVKSECFSYKLRFSTTEKHIDRKL